MWPTDGDGLDRDRSIDASTPQVSVLYGFQGAISFNLDNRSSFIDAVLRLVGPLRNINVAFLAADRNGNGLVVKHTLHDIANDKSLDPFCFDMLKNYLTKPSVITSRQVPFVHLLGDTLPKHHYQPTKDEEWPKEHAEDGLAYCTLSEDLHRMAHHWYDVAYLVVPPPIQDRNLKQGQKLHLASNQYREQLMLVARILTPGAGLAILKEGDAGIVPHCRFGLLKRIVTPLIMAPRFLTRGGMGFTQVEWDELVQCVFPANYDPALSDGFTRVRFLMQPLGSHTVSIFLAGVNSAECQEVSRLKNVVPPTSIRAGLASRIDRLVQSATTPVEQAQLIGVDIWPNGLFWDPEARPIQAGIGPCTEKSLEHIFDQPAVVPSVITIRPRYGAYTAHVVGSKDDYSIVPSRSFAFELDGTVAGFLDAVYQLVQHQIPGAGGSGTTQPSLWIWQRENSNRPEFYVTHETTQHEWLVICSQIVGPAIWVLPIDPKSIAKCNVIPASSSSSWGLRTSYHNFQTAAFHKALCTEKIPAREQSRSVNDNGKEYILSPSDGFIGLDVCTLCDCIFDTGTSAKKKLRHMVDAHGVLHKQLRATRPKAILGAGHKDDQKDLLDKDILQTTPRTSLKRKSETAQDTGSRNILHEVVSVSSPSVAGRTAAAKRRKIKFRGARDNDSAYRPHTDGSDDERDHDLGSAKLLAEDLMDEDQRKKQRRASAGPKKRVDDPTYRPRIDGSDDERDHDLGSAKFLAEDLLAEDQRKKQRRSGAGKKHVDDPSYRPSKVTDDEDDDKVKKVDGKTGPAPPSVKLVQGGGRSKKNPGGRSNDTGTASVPVKDNEHGDHKLEPSPVTAGVTTRAASKTRGKTGARKKAAPRGALAASTLRRGRSRNATPSAK
ncbi:hypothetical protein SEPCBS57363_003254 [Sporothrix epigloea]|uniref:Uncharacterized protein n=1 Tax=Sporothrix epigloea TaxID=1892477 RepID=A0ABP0DP38_9PEZI